MKHLGIAAVLLLGTAVSGCLAPGAAAGLTVGLGIVDKVLGVSDAAVKLYDDAGGPKLVDRPAPPPATSTTAAPVAP